jgi:hypothetical protein
MTVRESLDRVLVNLPEGRLRQVLDYAEFLALKQDLGDFRQLGKEQFAKAYGDNEPEYTVADLNKRGQP